MKVFHEEIGGMVEGPAFFEGQDEWVRKQDALEWKMDSIRLQTYLMGRCEYPDTHRNAILDLELRCFSDDYPTMDEWREAIDKAIRS